MNERDWRHPEPGALEYPIEDEQGDLVRMCDSGKYDPELDPFFTGTNPATTLAEALAEQRADIAAYQASSGFDAATNTTHLKGQA